MMYNKKKKSAETTTQFAHFYIERNASYLILCFVFPASKNPVYYELTMYYVQVGYL